MRQKLEYPLDFYIYDFIRKGQKEIPKGSHFHILTKNIPRQIKVQNQESLNSNVKEARISNVETSTFVTPDAPRGKKKIPFDNKKYLDFTK